MARMIMFASVALFVASAVAHAQQATPVVSSSPLTFGVFAGVALSSGEYEDDFAGPGLDLGFRVNVRGARQVIGLHVDVEYMKNGARTGVCPDADCSGRILAGFINVDAGLPIPVTIVRPYATAGLGYANLKLQATETSTPISSSDGAFAWNVGGGIAVSLGNSFGNWAAFAEVRYIQLTNVDVRLGPYRNVSGDVSMKPVSVGVTFHPCWSCAELKR